MSDGVDGSSPANSKVANVGDMEIPERQSQSDPWAAHKPKERQSQARLFGFADQEEIKKKVRERLLKPKQYNVHDYYKNEGKAQEIARHTIFENVTLFVITLNAVYISVDTDWNKEFPLTSGDTRSLTESEWPFQFMEHAFCVYFSGEIVIRFLAFKDKMNCRKDAWFVFDSCLVFLMVMETWVLLIYTLATGAKGGIGGTSILRLFRLMRLSRLMRMLRSLPELMILIKGMVSAMKSVMYVMCLLLLLTYVFAIAFTQLADNEALKEQFFVNVAHSMYSLMIYAIFLDNLATFMDALRLEQWYLLPIAMLFVALAALTVMNMLIGVLCEVVSAVAEVEKQEVLTLTITDKMRSVATSLDQNFDERVSYEEFQKIIECPEALKALEEVDVDPECVVEFAELFFFADGHPVSLSFEEFMNMVLDLQATNQAKVKDILNLWMQIKQTTNKEISELETKVDDLKSNLNTKTTNITQNLQLAMDEMKALTACF